MKTIVSYLGLVLLLGCGGESPIPDISEIEPRVASTLVETPAVIRGSALFNQITVDLGSQEQPSMESHWQVRIGTVELVPTVVRRLDETSISIVVPAGLEPGIHDVVLTSPGGTVALLPESLTIVAGPLGLPVTIEDAPMGLGSLVGTRSFAAGEEAALHAVARDSDGAFVADVAAEWLVEGSIGSIGEVPSSAATFQAEQVGSGRVTAVPVEASGSVSTGDFNVSPGAIAKILVRDQPDNGGAEVDSRTGTTDDTLEVYAAGYDAFGNYVGEAAATWAVTGGIGVAPVGPSVSTVIDYIRPGQGIATATKDDLVGTSGDLLIAPGRAASLAQQSTPLSISADATPMTLLVSARDEDGNDTDDLGTLAWSIVAGPISVLNAATGELDPTAAGSGVVRVTSSHGPSDDGSVTVTSGRAAALTVSPATASVSADVAAPAIDFDVTGTDGDGNPTSDLGTITWLVASGPITSIDGITGELDPTVAGVGSVRASSSHGVSGDSGAVQIIPGAAVAITVSPETFAGIENGTGTTFNASGVDGDGNSSSDLGTLTWSIANGPITAIAADGTFTPLTPGIGTVRATSSLGPTDDSSSVTVLNEAELVVSFGSMPVQVNTGQSFTVTMRVANVGESDASDVTPSALSQSGTTSATSIAGPTPSSASIAAGSFAEYTWTYAAAVAGTVDFSGSASGVDVNTGNAIISTEMTSSILTVEVPAALVASVSIPSTIGLGSTFVVDVQIDNVGGASATGVTTSITGQAGAGTATQVSGPSPPSATIAGGGFEVFTFSFTADTTGTIAINADGSGVDGNDGGARGANEATSNTANIHSEALLVSTDPFGDGTSFTHVFGYNDAVFLAPSADGTGAVSFTSGGAGVGQSHSFSFFRDSGSGASHRNLSASPFPSIGSPGCFPFSSACGPDNENGRGFFRAVTILGTEWLVAGGGRSFGDLDYVYMSVDTDAALEFNFVDLSKQLGGNTRGFSAAHAFNNRLYLGFPDNGGNRPYLISLITTPGSPGLNAQDNSDAIDLDANNLDGMDDSSPAMIDWISDFGGRLYVANAGAWHRATTTNPVETDDFNEVTPTAAAYGAKTSVTTNKLSNLEPADRAVPGMVAFGGHFFVARNSTTGPQLWFCDPSPGTHCDGNDWQLIAANSVGDLEASQFNDVNNTVISMLVATSTHLYVGFDNTNGIAVFRTSVASPITRSNWTGLGNCDAADHPTSCDSFGSAVIPQTNTRIFDGQAITSGAETNVFVVAGDGTSAVSVFRLLD